MLCMSMYKQVTTIQTKFAGSKPLLSHFFPHQTLANSNIVYDLVQRTLQSSILLRPIELNSNISD